MNQIYDERCTIMVEKKGKSVLLTTSNGIRWLAKTSSPQIAITNVVAHTMADLYANQERFDDKFIIKIIIQRLNDE